MNTIEIIEYGEIINSTLLTIFGDEMTYNELKFYAKNKDETTYLKVEWNRNKETQLVRVWFDNQIVMDKKYSIHHSCDMFNYLSEIETNKKEEEEEEEEKKDDESVSSFYLRCCDYCDEEYHYDDLTEIGEYDEKFYCKKCVEEIEEKKQNEKKKKEKKPKKKPILVLVEEEDEEEKILTASLEEKIKNAGIPTLVSIYGEQFKRRVSNMNASSIPLEKRKNLITKKILEKCTTIEIKKTIMDTYFTKKEKKQKDASWINDFVVGEEVLVLNTKPQTKYSRNITRKGLIQKINKTSVSVRLYGYNEIDDDNALKHQTHGYNRLIWWNFTNDSQVIYSKSALVKKGNCEYYDEQFIEGKRSVDYGN